MMPSRKIDFHTDLLASTEAAEKGVGIYFKVGIYWDINSIFRGLFSIMVHQ